MSDERKQVYRRVEHISFVEVPTGYVIDDDKNKRVIFLNLTAAAIFELCNGTNDVALIADLMKKACNLSAAPYDDVKACVWRLYRGGLIEPCMSPQRFRFLSFLRRLVKR
jgi:coenzyme PQQ synthesis protein D (PqqD)